MRIQLGRIVFAGTWQHWADLAVQRTIHVIQLTPSMYILLYVLILYVSLTPELTLWLCTTGKLDHRWLSFTAENDQRQYSQTESW